MNRAACPQLGAEERQQATRFVVHFQFRRSWPRVPHFDRLVKTRRRQPLPVRAKRYARDGVGVSFQRERLLARGGVSLR